MNFQESLDYLHSHAWLGSIYGIDTMRDLAEALDHPERRLAIIHIAGTNGKGSTVAALSAVLMAAGYQIASYTSPEVHTYLDRFLMQQQCPSEAAFARAMTKVADAADAVAAEGKPHATVFEMELACAWLLALDAQVDFFIMETGLGGSMDATNVVEQPLLTAITAIGLDHTRLLGDHITDIAQAKAGIIKPGVPVITWPAIPEVQKVFDEQSAEQHAPHLSLLQKDITDIALHDNGTAFRYQGTPYHMALIGEHQAVNAAGVIEMAHALQKNGYILTDEAIQQGLRDCRWPGRFELCHRAPTVYLDGAHNPNAMAALIQTVHHRYPNVKPHLVLHIFEDKPVHAMLDLWSEQTTRIYCPNMDFPRSLPTDQLVAMIHKQLPNVSAFICSNLIDALNQSIKEAAPDDVIIVCGSLSHLATARTYLQTLERNPE